MTKPRRTVLVLGSTGSIGTQALEVAMRYPAHFRIAGIAAAGSDPALIASQALAHAVDAVAVADDAAVVELELAIRARADRLGLRRGPRIFAGPNAVTDLIDAVPVDVVLNGMPGSQGLVPSLRALGTGATLALANKESLVAGGSLLLAAARPGQIVPVDSEHSAIAQALCGNRSEDVARLVLTASGGPFRGYSRAQLADVKLTDALKHPTWSMGPVVTINSATLVNKGLELIEAQLLFSIEATRIDVVVHPQSVVHSMVTFVDGATLLQASPPDMRLPIALGLSWPDRIADVVPPCRWDDRTAWTFEPLDDMVFPAVRLARHVSAARGCLPAVYNAANEVMVSKFLQRKADFTSIVDNVAQVVECATGWCGEPRDVEDVLAAEHWARARAEEVSRVL